MRSDDRLAQRATKGDRRAFEAIYERYHQDLYRYCLAMLGNPQDAQDTLQNTMVKVLRALPGEERKIQLKPWLYRIARNEAIETMRARRDTAEIEPEHVASASDLEIAESAEARERLRKLFTDLGELPERQRAALVMRELGGLGFEEIGAAFNSSAAVARQTIYEARRSLRQMEAGRAMGCEEVMRQLSDADGRVTRRRELRAHVRSCRSCRVFQEEISQRRGDLAAIAPLPLAASAGLLHGILAGKASGAVSAGAGAASGAGGGGGLVSTVGAGAGKAVATSALVKSAAAAVVVAAVGVSAADRSGLIDVSIPGVHNNSSVKSAPASPGKGGPPSQASAAARQGSAAGSSGNASASDSATAGAGVGHHQGASAAGAEHEGASGAQSNQAHAGARHHHHHRQGLPAEPPPAAEHGQQTAAEHKPPPPESHPSAQSHPTTGGETAPKPAPPPREAAPPETLPPTEPRTEPRMEPPGGASGRRRALEAQELEP